MASFVGRFAGRVAASASAAAAANAAQPTAQARAPVQVAERAPQNVNRKSLDEEWLLTEFDKETLLFKPYKVEEIDAAVAEVYAMAGTRVAPPAGAAGPSVVIEEVGGDGARRASETGTADTSEGVTADLVIEQASMRGAPAPAPASASQAQLSALLQVTSKLMQRPGFQREVVACMLEEAEVRDLILRLDERASLDAYLAAVGIHSPGLLPPAAAAAVAAAAQEAGAQGGEEGEEGENPVDKIMRAIEAVINRANSALAGLGGWLRDRMQHIGRLLAAKLGVEQEEEQEEHVDAAGAQASGRSGRRPPGPLDTVMGAVAVVALGVVCVLLARRPVVLRTMSRA
uniref:Uncharacterized protein n=1 Tax=Chlamydomonas leiostraca TaxID=1034604 RepID=A0A7S0R4A8_9CHLO|mmetsp:Transcript_13536/g.33212  ORF Transcript_13536/g.33212 Transcript_13536/m.33212 type:complete len:344 (+) Transcript_13536:105-1136(+)|eukprot:CAMPEP_0202865942 /NCGR_PEP_ID=MMETSP1391-20130828/6755_1 /ASSEMBLY_ACC=CAM_ASM_000867 /TAXON_ID=1034604 /ORGANISM="Chlamydomonas leiostraca, Strain SAG 11-49" /LENGTH=343 /DNA_ID=CAMNT_0049545833 /DNA_START=82 /DNA_END=1113 /DNA_ORIENTATION=+